MRLLLLASIALLLTSCMTSSTYNRLMTFNQKDQVIKTADGTFRIYAHPTENTLGITPSRADVIGQGAVRGATLGIVSPTTATDKFQRAASAFLENSGRTGCSVGPVSLIIEPIYEVKFSCP